MYFPDVNDSDHTEGEIDKEIADAIHNDATGPESICCRIGFNNGMSDMTIEPEKDFLFKVF